MSTSYIANFGRVLGSLVALTLTTAACEQTQTSRFGRPSSEFPGVRSAQTKLLSIPPSGTEMDAPQKVRFYRYWDANPPPDPGVSSCFVVPDDPNNFHTIMSGTFTTASTTSYIELAFSAQFSTFSGTDDPYEGILGLATVTQGSTSQIFPGMGDEFNPFLARRDEASNGQQVYGGYQGIVTADPSTSTTVTVELQSTQGQAYACFFDMIVRY